jgi:hypothetical protein
VHRIALCVLSAVLVGCAQGPAEDPGPRPSVPGRATDREIYEDVRLYCSAFTPTKLAEAQGIDETDPMSVALAVADDYAPEAQRAAARGCFDALTEGGRG